MVRRICPGDSTGPCRCSPPCRVEGPRGGSKGNQTLRCPDCRRSLDRLIRERRPLRKTRVEVDRRRVAVEEHVAAYGWFCLGDDGAEAGDAGHRPHPCVDLTADHRIPVARGTTEDERMALERGPLDVRCRQRNSQLRTKLRSKQ